VPDRSGAQNPDASSNGASRAGATSPSAPLSALPSPLARALAFISILIGGLAGGLIGYAFLDLQSDSSTWPAVGGLIGALAAAGGTAVIAVLVLRAMGEWKHLQDR
jgi:anti-sigma factor RsiW